MKCPNCEIPLMMTERKGIEIDFCTQCRGVWLDRGELDKIIAVSTAELASQNSQAESARPDEYRKEHHRPAKSDRKRQYVEDRDRDRYKDRDRDRDIERLFDLFD